MSWSRYSHGELGKAMRAASREMYTTWQIQQNSWFIDCADNAPRLMSDNLCNSNFPAPFQSLCTCVGVDVSGYHPLEHHLGLAIHEAKA